MLLKPKKKRNKNWAFMELKKYKKLQYWFNNNSHIFCNNIIRNFMCFLCTFILILLLSLLIGNKKNKGHQVDIVDDDDGNGNGDANSDG